LGIGDWGLGPIPNPQSPIPNPQSPIPNPQLDEISKNIENLLKIFYYKFYLIVLFIKYIKRFLLLKNIFFHYV
jgi:hypothetical protein